MPRGGLLVTCIAHRIRALFVVVAVEWMTWSRSVWQVHQKRAGRKVLIHIHQATVRVWQLAEHDQPAPGALSMCAGDFVEIYSEVRGY